MVGHVLDLRMKGATQMSLMHEGQLSLVAGIVRYRNKHLGYRH